MKKQWMIALFASVALVATIAWSQQPAGPPAGGKGGFGKGGFKGKGPGRGAPQYRLEKGQNIDPRPSTKTDGHPVFEGQTRAPYEPSGQAYEVATITDKLQEPWSIAFLPGGKFLVTEKPGRMRVVSADGTVSEPIKGVPQACPTEDRNGKQVPAPFISPCLHYQGQVGLLDLALDRNFAQNRRIFFSYSEQVSDTDSHIVVASANLSADMTAITNVKTILGSMPALANQRYGANQGGRLAVAQDGNLFAIIGDRAPTPPSDYAQQTDTTIGKVLRLTPEGKPAPGNPFIGRAGYAPEIYSMGHRSTEGLAINPANGELWSTEHGPQGGDELNKIEAGKNYGWPVISHGIDYNGQPIKEGIVEKAGLEQPRYYWNPVIAPSGLAFYQGNQFPGWKDSIFAGGLGGQLISCLHMDWKTNKAIGEEPLLIDPAVRTRVRDVRFGPDGMLYVLTDTNSLLKVTPKK